MPTKIPVSIREYELPFNEDLDSEEDTSESEVTEISIEGYKLIFDKKVMVTPLELIAVNPSKV